MTVSYREYAKKIREPYKEEYAGRGKSLTVYRFNEQGFRISELFTGFNPNPLIQSSTKYLCLLTDEEREFFSKFKERYNPEFEIEEDEDEGVFWIGFGKWKHAVRYTYELNRLNNLFKGE